MLPVLMDTLSDQERQHAPRRRGARHQFPDDISYLMKLLYRKTAV